MRSTPDAHSTQTRRARRNHFFKVAGAFLAVALSLWSAPLAAQEESTESSEQREGELEAHSRLIQEIEDLKKGQEQIRSELDEIKKLLLQRPTPRSARRPPAAGDVRDVAFELATPHSKGESTSPLTLVEFTDYE